MNDNDIQTLDGDRSWMDGLDKSKFVFVQKSDILHDKKLDTKPVGYFKDAWRRFSKNKGSVTAFIIIIILMLFAVFGPVFSKYSVSFSDGYYNYAAPKSLILSKIGIFTGNRKMNGVSQQNYDYFNAIPGAIVKVEKKYQVKAGAKKSYFYDLTVDTYKKVGYVYKTLSKTEYDEVRAYEKKTGKVMLYPVINRTLISDPAYENDPNVWFIHDGKGRAVYNADGSYQNMYIADADTQSGFKEYNEKNGGKQYEVVVLYHDWFVYKNGFEPAFLFGVDGFGKDIFVCLAAGARLSFLLSISVSLLNFIIGLIYGAIEGYYGGAADLIMERFVEILSEVPFVVVVTLFQIYLSVKAGPILSLLFAFVFTGWIGTSNLVRTQFYRFKGQEYVLAARTLGARDSRLIFRHILPNAIGMIITSAVLMIPGVIMSESVLSFLGIVNLQTSDITSVGTLLSNGQGSLSTYPHVLFFPALFISLLMICFNMFGNGLRDAFNPSLRGSDD
jgi:oligopeptide transport system permease protein